MTDKRFMTQYGIKIHDLHKGNEYLVNEVDAHEIVDLLNRLDMTVKERSKGMSTLQKKIDELNERNEQIKHLINEAYETERTELGRSVLRQLKEAIE